MSELPPSPGGIAADAYSARIMAMLANRNYEVLGELGRGGMGVVYLARDKKLGRKVALKTLSPERATRENSLRRFEREARTFAQIRHPHIATLYEFADDGPLQYLALEYIDGYDLESERKRGRIWKAREAARIVRTVCEALEYTHGMGILHRDIKPGNILIERRTNRVVLTDFGLAKSRNDETLTASGFAVGTPAYMAPEQISDQFGSSPDGRSDLFSLGTVFYEMVTGRHPFLGSDDLKTMRNIVHAAPLPPREINPDLPADLEQVLLGMLKKNPADRLDGAAAAKALLEEWLDTSESSPSPPQSTPAVGTGDVPAGARSGPARPKATADANPSLPPPATGVSVRAVIAISAAVGALMLALGLALAFLLFGG